MTDDPAGNLTLFVEGLTVKANIGVNHHERGRLQPLIFDVEMTIVPPETDAISKTLDYNMVIAAVHGVLSRGHIELVEYVAHRVGIELLRNERVLNVSVRVAKPEAFGAALAAGARWSSFRREVVQIGDKS